MMRAMIILTLALSLGGCASAQIDVQSDLYKKETAADHERKVAQEKQELINVVQGITESKKVAAACGEKVKRLATDLVDVTIAYQGLHSGLRPKPRPFSEDGARKPYEQQRPGFDKEVDDAVDRATLAADQAQLALADYVAKTLDPALDEKQRQVTLLDANASFVTRVDVLNAAMKAIINVFREGTSPYASALRSNIQPMSEGLKEIRGLTAPGPEQKTLSDNLAKHVEALARSSDDLAKQCAQLPPSLPRDLMASANKIKGGTLAGIQESLPALVRNLQTVTGSLELGSGAIADIRNLAINQTFYESQIDRVQDPADPGWREVLDPANEGNWATVFARTSFRAEGKTDVIVVRDRPGHFRVQRGVNNPAVLIQGQLEISRSVASAATAILGAISGINVPLVSDKESSTPGPVATVKAGNSTDSVRGSTARVDEAQRVRVAARTGLAAELQRNVRDLLALKNPEDKDKAKRDAIYAQLAPLLKAYANLLKFTGEEK